MTKPGVDAHGVAQTDAIISGIVRVAGSGSICATLIKYWRTFTTLRLRSAKVRSRPRPKGCNDAFAGTTGRAIIDAKFNAGLFRFTARQQQRLAAFRTGRS